MNWLIAIIALNLLLTLGRKELAVRIDRENDGSFVKDVSRLIN